jgi:hypothetical protein
MLHHSSISDCNNAWRGTLLQSEMEEWCNIPKIREPKNTNFQKLYLKDL